MTGHDRYRVGKAREVLDSLDMGDDRAMARTIGRLEVALQQLLEMVDEELPDPGDLPVLGPTELQNAHDDTGPAVVIVRVHFALSWEELQTALVYGYAESNVDRPIGELSVEEVRAEVEGYLGFTGYAQMLLHVESERVRRPEDPAMNAAVDAALARAYSARTQPEPPAVQAPRYEGGMVTLQTLDAGEITVSEPRWCVGHGGELVGHRADVTHNGEWLAAEVASEEGPVEFLRARISWAPFGELQPEPLPVADVEDFPAMDAEELRGLAAEVGRHSGRLYAKANELDRLRRAGA